MIHKIPDIYNKTNLCTLCIIIHTVIITVMCTDYIMLHDPHILTTSKAAKSTWCTLHTHNSCVYLTGLLFPLLLWTGPCPSQMFLGKGKICTSRMPFMTATKGFKYWRPVPVQQLTFNIYSCCLKPSPDQTKPLRTDLLAGGYQPGVGYHTRFLQITSHRTSPATASVFQHLLLWLLTNVSTLL